MYVVMEGISVLGPLGRRPPDSRVIEMVKEGMSSSWEPSSSFSIADGGRIYSTTDRTTRRAT